MRKQLVAGNWKMNCTLAEGEKLASEIIHTVETEIQNNAEVILIPPFIHIARVQSLVGTSKNIHVGAQNCHQNESGAYTGEISASMLRSCDVSYVVIGHSERRAYFNECDSLLAKKITQVLANGILPVFCCGEKQEPRDSNTHEAVVEEQIQHALFHLPEAELLKTVIAYEPVWAIGTGMTASAEQVQEMHAFIRALLASRYSTEVAEQLSILYGGSIKPSNAKDIFSQPDVDGGLIGGASLKSRDFIEIIKAFG